MTDHTGLHERCVDAWLASRDARKGNNARMTELLLAGLRSIWQRARPSLGDVTLAAIVQRAIHTSERRHDELAQIGLRVTDGGVIELTNPSAPRVDLDAAVRCVLVEVLHVLGELTAGALTPALHAALAAAAEESPAFVLLRSSSNRSDGRDDERGTP
ncbi:MAG: hypothetical protein QOI41_3994 [Myxococcales bacterium]|jgi:hypothetical protein|nr:hypothetical protein [Myxococcales bacterium]